LRRAAHRTADDMTYTYRTCFLVAIFASFAAYLPTQAADERPPNIVLIYGDDVGYGDLGCYGASSIPTPHIDELARHGLRFTSAYCTSATCTPSRYSLLTGEYAWRRPDTGIAPPNSPALIRPGTPTLASLLREAGYRTGIVGKWHLGLGNPPKPNWSGELKPGPLEVGFDEAFILPTTNDRVPCVYVRGHRVEGLDLDDPIDVYARNPDNQPTGQSQRDLLTMNWSHGHNDSIVNGIGRIGFMTGGRAIRWNDETMAETFVREARAFLERDRERPFFLFYSAHEIHVPRVPNPQFVGSTPHGPRGDVAVEFDWCVGQLMQTLESLGVAENTLVLLSSDNGPVLDDGYQDHAVERLGDHRPAGPYRGGKYSRYEGGCRVPWIVHWPARVRPGVSDAMLTQVDLSATLATLAGVVPGDGAAPDSENHLDALLGDSSHGRDYIVTHTGKDKLAVRRGKWKYIEPAGGPKVNANTHTELANRDAPQLYDIASDLGETKNLAAGNPDLVSELQKILRDARASRRAVDR
ncbi:MAG: arylsulfatase, partial [Planctomycetales bacterium]|nr:arylsulfatase [Planctomycetales bacterium]